MKFILAILAFIISTEINSQNSENSNSKNQILFYGLMDSYTIMAMEFAAEKYNIEVTGIAGCMVSRKLIDSTERVHQNLWKRMDSIYGTGAKENYEKNVRIEYIRIKESYEIMNNTKKIKKLIRKTKKENEDVSVTLKEKMGADNYVWLIHSLNTEKCPKEIWCPEYKIVVNLNKKDSQVIKLR